MKKCKVPDCERLAKTRGWCHAHYMQWWYNGKITKTSITTQGAPANFVRAAAHHRSKKCLRWPYGTYDKGKRGSVFWRGRARPAHQVVCELVNGPRPSKKHGALHTCDDGLCCNGQHLYWGTQTDNMKDAVKRNRIARGSGNGVSKLTEQDVKQIRKMRSNKIPVPKIALRFNVTRSNIYAVLKGTSWGWL